MREEQKPELLIHNVSTRKILVLFFAPICYSLMNDD